MKRLGLALILVLFLALLVPFAFSEEDAPAITGRFYTKDGVKVLELWGTPRERGFAHGYLLAGEIVSGAESGFQFVEKFNPGTVKHKVLPLAGSGFSFSEAETEELAGILEGMKARLPAEKLVVPALGRALTLVDLKALNTFGDWYALGCSSAAVWGGKTEDGTAAVVRNFDFMGLPIVQKHQMLVVLAPGPDEQECRGFIGITHPGSVGAITALSEEGVFAAIHDVMVRPQPKDFMQGNVPRLLAIRRIVREIPAKGAVEVAAQRCKVWNTLFGNNFMVATPLPGDGLPAGVIEYDTREETDGGAVLRGPATTEQGTAREFVVCSNHHRLRARGQCDRYQDLETGAREAAEARTVPMLFALAARSAVPRDGSPVLEGGFGTQHEVVALTGKKLLYVRVVEVGRSIAEVEPVEFDAVKLLAAVREQAE
jgi:hypothetical protein